MPLGVCFQRPRGIPRRVIDRGFFGFAACECAQNDLLFGPQADETSIGQLRLGRWNRNKIYDLAIKRVIRARINAKNNLTYVGQLVYSRRMTRQRTASLFALSVCLSFCSVAVAQEPAPTITIDAGSPTCTGPGSATQIQCYVDGRGGQATGAGGRADVHLGGYRLTVRAHGRERHPLGLSTVNVLELGRGVVVQDQPGRRAHDDGWRNQVEGDVERGTRCT